MLCHVSQFEADNGGIRFLDVFTSFVFGDSFVSNGYWRDFGYPEKIETIMPGRYETTTGGLNCIQYAAQQAGLLDSVYTLAMSGASITSSRFLEPKSDWMNPSLWNETDAFRQYFTGEEALATWEPSSTLFFISGGVNEITRGDEAGWDYISWIPDILDDYVGQAQMLYGLGGMCTGPSADAATCRLTNAIESVRRTARHFVFTNMMPVGRTPGGLPLTHFAAWIHSWNFAFQKRFSTLEAEMPGATVRIWDWNELINEVREGILAGRPTPQAENSHVVNQNTAHR
jgi:hypothetical protein